MGPNFDDAVACELQFVLSADYNSAFSVYHQSMYPVMTLHVLTDILLLPADSDESVSCLHYSYFTLHISQLSSLFI